MDQFKTNFVGPIHNWPIFWFLPLGSGFIPWGGSESILTKWLSLAKLYKWIEYIKLYKCTKWEYCLSDLTVREHVCSIERMLDAQQDNFYGGQTSSIGRSKDLRENKKIMRLPSKSRPEGFYSLETNCSAGREVDWTGLGKCAAFNVSLLFAKLLIRRWGSPLLKICFAEKELQTPLPPLRKKSKK